LPGSIKKALIIDDEEYIREVIIEVLKLWSVECLQAGDGKEAIEVCKKYHDEIDLVFLDLNLPNLSGREVYEKLVTILPEKPFVFMSGYDEDHSSVELPKNGNFKYLKKPFFLESIKSLIEEIGK